MILGLLNIWAFSGLSIKIQKIIVSAEKNISNKHGRGDTFIGIPLFHSEHVPCKGYLVPSDSFSYEYDLRPSLLSSRHFIVSYIPGVFFFREEVHLRETLR